jgi:NitT/TauT family transport system permease protein
MTTGRGRAGSGVRGRFAHAAVSLSGVCAFVVLWQIVAVLKDDPIVLVAPTKVLETAWRTVRTAEYWLHWRVSMWEYAIGMTLAITTGVVGGAVLGQVALLKRALDPVLTGFYSTPTVALAPLFILWFGLGTLSKVMVVWYVAFLPIIVISATGIANVDPAYLDVARVFRTSRWRTVFSVLLPAAMPSVIGGIRVGSGVGLIGIILGEFFGSEAGLGYLVLYATNRFDLALLLVGVMSLALVGILIAAVLTLLERKWSG